MEYSIKNLRCPKCHNKLMHNRECDTLYCATDCITYPILDGVPLMYVENEKYLAREAVRSGLINALTSLRFSGTSREIFRRLGVSNPGKADIRLLNRLLSEAEAIRKQGSAPELGCFEDRFGITRSNPLPRTARLAQANVNDARVQLSYPGHNFPRELPVGLKSSFNVRLKNEGAAPLDKNAVVLSYVLSEKGKYVRDGPRTPLPISLPSGRDLSLPLVFDTTGLAPGDYRIEIGALIEQVSWFPDRLGFDLKVVSDFSPIQVTKNQLPSQDYSSQHTYSNTWLEKKLRDLAITPRDCLEIGCGCSPQNPGFLSKADSLICMDISHLLARLGYSTHKTYYRTRCRFISGDALNMPFADNSFNLVTMYATLHHFSDPHRLIGELIRITGDGGAIAIMCEPWGSDLAYAARDLEAGIDEKTYSLEEYDRMFNREGCRIHEIHLDGGSLNLIASIGK